MDDTRTRLIHSAFSLLRESGLQAVTLRAVGDRAGLSRTAPYRHFAHKSALLAALAAGVITDLTAEISRLVLAQATPTERLHAFYTAYVGYALRHPEEYRLVFTKDLDPHHPELEEATDRAMNVLGLLYPDGPQLSEAELLALMATAHGLAELATGGMIGKKGVSAADVVDAVIRLPHDPGWATVPPTS